MKTHTPCRSLLRKEARRLPLLALPAILALAAPAEAQFANPVPDTTLSGRLPASTQRRILLGRLDVALQQVKTARARFEAGQATSDEVAKLEAAVRDLELQIQALDESASLEQRIAGLQRTVDVELKNASVLQAAEALTKATGVPILAAGDVNSDRRISLQAAGVPLVRVVEAIARANHLMIAPHPKEDQGVQLRQWPSLVINDERKVYMAPTAPWSEEWFPERRFLNTLRRGDRSEFRLLDAAPVEVGAFPGPAPSSPPGGAAPAPSLLPTTPDMAAPAPLPTNMRATPTVTVPAPALDLVQRADGPLRVAPRDNPFDPNTSSAARAGGPALYGPLSGYPPPTSGQPVQALSVASLGGNLFVVVEPAAGPALEPGAWLTVYRLEGQKLVRVTRQFHDGSVPRPALGAPGMFGGMGRPGTPPGASGFGGRLGAPSTPPGAPVPAAGSLGAGRPGKAPPLRGGGASGGAKAPKR